MLKRLIILFLLFSSILSFSQEVETKPKNDVLKRFFFGGNFGLQFGYKTFIDVSPLVGYKFTDKFSSGVGFIYNYYSNNVDGYKFNTNIYGGKIFGSYFIYDNLFLHSEIEALSLETVFFDYAKQYQNQDRFLVTSILVGGGYKFMLGKNSGVNAMILFNLNESANSPYTNPIFRLGFVF
ncbi:MAG: hypothetical protein A2046_03590 [Bacteroidetes bacterium GWA2_30_7]|nr:MAG: hypothetical protein A2046_03590 [Bacteroidetes bacterium GWA2_30_7]